MKILAILLALLVLPAYVQAKSYKCKANGKTTYQQSPCKANENVDSYKHYEESEATKASLAKSRKEKADKEAARLEAKRKYESSAEHKTAVMNARTAKINANTQAMRGISESRENTQRLLDKEERTIRSLMGIRRP